MSSLVSKKSWADLANETSESDEEDDFSIDTTAQSIIQKSQSQNLEGQLSQLPKLDKQTVSADTLPKYFQRILQAVKEQPGSYIELVIRDCPKNATEFKLKECLPIVSCNISNEFVTVIIKKEDVIKSILENQLQQVQPNPLKIIIYQQQIMGQMCTLSVQRPSQELCQFEQSHNIVQTQELKQNELNHKQQEKEYTNFKPQQYKKQGVNISLLSIIQKQYQKKNFQKHHFSYTTQNDFGYYDFMPTKQQKSIKYYRKDD